MTKMKYIGVLILALASISAHGQKFSVSTNAVGYACLGTLNAEASYAFARRWSLTAGVKYNPFTISSQDSIYKLRQQAYSVGVRFWPWHTYSGWWVASKLQYQEYSFGGVLSPETEEGDKFGASFGAGYTYMVHPRINIDFGLGFWAGVKKFARYDCPRCGLTVDSGTKGFILPNDIIIGISYVF